LPRDNEKDLADIPKNVLDTARHLMVDTMDEVLKIALAGPLPAIARPRRDRRSAGHFGRYDHALMRLSRAKRYGCDSEPEA
jgi:hypothetical protein